MMSEEEVDVYGPHDEQVRLPATLGGQAIRQRFAKPGQYVMRTSRDGDSQCIAESQSYQLQNGDRIEHIPAFRGGS